MIELRRGPEEDHKEQNKLLYIERGKYYDIRNQVKYKFQFFRGLF